MNHLLGAEEIQGLIPGAIFFVVIPWIIFVSTSIFSLRQQVALLRAEIGALDKIQLILAKMAREEG